MNYCLARSYSQEQDRLQQGRWHWRRGRKHHRRRGFRIPGRPGDPSGRPRGSRHALQPCYGGHVHAGLRQNSQRNAKAGSLLNPLNFTHGMKSNCHVESRRSVWSPLARLLTADNEILRLRTQNDKSPWLLTPESLFQRNLREARTQR